MKRTWPLALSRAKALRIAQLLDAYAHNLKSEIESSTLADGTIQPNDDIAAHNVPIARREMKLAESYAALLKGRKP